MSRSLGYTLLATVGALALLSGCGGPAPAGPSTGGTAAGGKSPQASAVASTSMDLGDWTPPVIIQRKTVTEADRQASFDQQRRAALLEGVDEASLPKPELVRWVATRSEQWPLVRDCMTEAGFPVELGPLGEGLAYDTLPAAQEAAFRAEYYRCVSAYPIDPANYGNWSKEQISVVYSYWTEFYLPCMHRLGHDYKKETPSEGAFRDSFGAKEGLTWWPIEMSMMLKDDELAQAQAQCPAYPPASALYGG